MENQEYLFLDDCGFVLRPVFTSPPEQKRFLFITTICAGAFTFERTEARREDLVRKLESGEITIDRGPSSIRVPLNLVRCTSNIVPNQARLAAVCSMFKVRCSTFEVRLRLVPAAPGCGGQGEGKQPCDRGALQRIVNTPHFSRPQMPPRVDTCVCVG